MKKNILITVTFILLSLNCFANTKALNYPKSISILNNNLDLAYNDGTIKQYIYEYIDKNKNLYNWVNMVAFRNYSNYQPKSIIAYTINNIKKSVPNIKYSAYENNKRKNHYILEFLTASQNKKNPKQNIYEYNVWYFFPSTFNETISIQYAFRFYNDKTKNLDSSISQKEYIELIKKNKKQLILEVEALSDKVFSYIK